MADHAVINLNVGGMVHTTSLSTIRKFPDSMLGAMFSGQYEIPVDNNGHIFIDRDGDLFRFVLNYMRGGSLCLPSNFTELDQLIKEADFFQIEPLIDDLHIILKERQDREKEKKDREKEKEQEEALSKFYFSLEIMERVNIRNSIFYRSAIDDDVEVNVYGIDNTEITISTTPEEDQYYYECLQDWPHDKMRCFLNVRGRKSIVEKYVVEVKCGKNLERGSEDFITETMEPQFTGWKKTDRLYIREKLLGQGWVLQNSVTTVIKESDPNNMPAGCSPFHLIIRDLYNLSHWHHLQNTKKAN